MPTFKIIVLNVASDISPCFLETGPTGKISFFVLEAPEPTFNHNVIGPTALTNHALSDTVARKKCFLFRASELTSLIRIKDIGLDNLECFFAGLNTSFRVESIIQLPSDDQAAIPVNNGCQIQNTVLNRDIGVSIDQA